MRGFEITLFVASLIAILIIMVAEYWRAREISSATLSAPMLLTIRITLGIIFLILGVIGSLLPVLQGWLFFLLAALMLFPRSRFAVKVLDKAEPKMPRLVAWLRRWGVGTHDEHDTIRAG